MKKLLATIGLAAAMLAGAQAADQYWRTDGTAGGNWTSTYWNIGSANATGGTGWTAANNAVFTANSTLTFATSTVGNVTVSNSSNVTITAAVTLTLGGVRTFDIQTGSTLTWTSQTQSTAAGNEGAGVIKNGAGTLNWGAGPGTNVRFNGGFTLNDGTVIVSSTNSLSSGALKLNGGTLQSSGTTAFTSTSIVIGGDFALTGTGNNNWDAATTIALGSSTRTITNTISSGSRQFRGLISGGAGAGLTFAGNSTGLTYIGNATNSFTGPVTINGGEVVLNGDGALGSTTSITIDGGRLTMGSMDTGGNVTALTSATISSSKKNIFLGSTASTAINISGSTGVTTYGGVIADKSGATGALTKQGNGTLSLGGVSTYTGATAINSGILQLSTGNDRLPTGTVVSLGQASSTNLGTLDLNGHSQQIAGLQSTSGTNAGASTNVVTSASAAILTLNNSSDHTYSAGTAANSGVISGAISLVKEGSGNQTLGGANTYTGTTTVNSGTLLLSGGGMIGTGNLVLGGGTFSIAGITAGNYTLSSTQSLTGAGSINATGKEFVLNGTLAPGNSPGTIDVTGNFTLGAASVSNFDINGTTSGLFDRLNVTGTLTLGGTLNLTTGYSAALGQSVKLFNADTYSGSSFTSVTGTTLGAGLYWDTGTLATDGTITVVPEPRAWVMIGIGVWFMLWNVRRKRRLQE